MLSWDCFAHMRYGHHNCNARCLYVSLETQAVGACEPMTKGLGGAMLY